MNGVSALLQPSIVGHGVWDQAPPSVKRGRGVPPFGPVVPRRGALPGTQRWSRPGDQGQCTMSEPWSVITAWSKAHCTCPKSDGRSSSRVCPPNEGSTRDSSVVMRLSHDCRRCSSSRKVCPVCAG